MKNILKTSIACLLLTATMSSAGAAVVQLGSISKAYGTGGVTPESMTGPGSCDTAAATSITVNSIRTGCQRFYDVFDFSSYDYTSLDRLELTLNFGATNNGLEFWKVRFADSAVHGSGTTQAMTRASSPPPQTFTLRPSQNDVFSLVEANGKLFLWFADDGASFGSINNFNLASARLDVFGTAAVPEPGTIALFGIALGVLGMSRRKLG